MDQSWVYEDSSVDWEELTRLYRVAPLGEKAPEDLATVFSNSRYKCFVYADGDLIGVGRALADGLDCSYIADVAVHPEHQGNRRSRQPVEQRRRAGPRSPYLDASNAGVRGPAFTDRHSVGNGGPSPLP